MVVVGNNLSRNTHHVLVRPQCCEEYLLICHGFVPENGVSPSFERRNQPERRARTALASCLMQHPMVLNSAYSQLRRESQEKSVCCVHPSLDGCISMEGQRFLLLPISVSAEPLGLKAESAGVKPSIARLRC